MSTIETIRAITEKQCPVDVLLHAVTDHKCGTCGKCVYGYEGAWQIGTILKDATERKGRNGDMALLQDAADMMKKYALCEDGIELAEGTLEALESYREDFESHIAKKGCRTGVCKKFMTYHILPDKCVGCTDCLDACDEDAILGKKKFVHVIDQDECTQCGECLEACEEEAIVTAGAVKPRCPKKPIPCKR